MINIELPTGKTLSMTTFEWLFMLKDEDINEFYQSCIADDLGEHIDDPFSGKIVRGRLEIEDVPDVLKDEEDIL